MDPATLNIQDLPEEVFLIIVEFLPGRDLDACFNVCKSWRRIINDDKLWKKCCNYSEKYFKLSVQLNKNPKSVESCKWRKNFLIQEKILDNWNSRRFVTEKLPICLLFAEYFMASVDDYGNHWLFVYRASGISIHNITSKPITNYFCSNEVDPGVREILHLKDRILVCSSYCVKVYQFRHPDYSLKLMYKFKTEESQVLPTCEVVTSTDYQIGACHILVDDQYFIGYNDDIANYRSAFIHIWDLDSGKKLATQSVFQQSFVDFCKSKSRSDITDNFPTRLSLCAGDNGMFLVNLFNENLALCQISLFSLVEMKFVKVVSQFEGRNAWCFMKGNIVVIFHTVEMRSSHLSVYNISIEDGFLAKLVFPGTGMYALNNYTFLLEGSKVILKEGNKINVLTISDSVKVNRNHFEIDYVCELMKYYDPKFLILCVKLNLMSLGYNVGVWDINTGVKLWILPNKLWVLNYHMLNKSNYPGKYLVQFYGETEISILNFSHDS